MTTSSRAFSELVESAHEGRIKLPAFQRKWRWKSDKVIKLFDSLRLGYPIGSLLFLKGENELLAPRSFEGAKPAGAAQADFLVLDGQQRITAGIHLYFGTGKRQYYVDLVRLQQLVQEKGVDLEDKVQAEQLAKAIDETDGYLVGRVAVPDPRALLVNKHLLCTSILTDQTELGVALADYVKTYPGAANLAYRLVLPHFNLAKTDSVPVIEIDSSTQIEAISRIFTTLNTTGQLLTPFELVVSILYPKKIDLSQDIREFREQGTYYRNMDATGEVLLQTVALLDGEDPKKANLPKTINAALYQKNKSVAFQALDALGKFLTDKFGAALGVTGDMTPYDAIFAPMAVAFLDVRAMKGKALISAERKIAKWYVGAALSTRYQEGVHNKQKRDLAEFRAWLASDNSVPPWITEVNTPRLLRVSPNGAIGKLLRGLLNSQAPRDPASDHPIGFGSGLYSTEKHHIFPTKYLPTFANWTKKDTSDVILNLMFLEDETNKRWINGNPVDHLAEAYGMRGKESVRAAYEKQFMDATAIQLLEKPEKTKNDFYAFLALREMSFQSFIEAEFGFSKSTTAPGEEEEGDGPDTDENSGAD